MATPTDDISTILILNGQMKEGPANGIYSMVTWEGESLSGAFQNGSLNGKGSTKRTNGEFQEGIFKDGVLQDGTCNWKDKNVKNEGIIKNGRIFEGVESNYEDDKLVSEQYYSDGSIWKKTQKIDFGDTFYVGEVSDGQANGYGKLFSKTGKFIGEGEFQANNLVTGYKLIGEDAYINGRKLNGFGMSYLKDRVLVGVFGDGLLSGLGAEVGVNYELKIGTFENNMLVDGKHFKDFVLREGKFSRGLLNGEGSVKYFSAERVGNTVNFKPPEDFNNWKEACLNGTNLKEVSDSMGEFDNVGYENGTFKNGLLNGEGISVLNGCTRKGIFFRGKLHGQGERKWVDGKIEQGKFFKDELENRVIRNRRVKSLFSRDLEIRLSLNRNPESKGSYKQPTVELFENCFEVGDFDKNKLMFGNLLIKHVPGGVIDYEFKYGVPTGLISIKNKQFSLKLKISEGTATVLENSRNQSRVNFNVAPMQQSQINRSIIPVKVNYNTVNGKYTWPLPNELCLLDGNGFNDHIFYLGYTTFADIFGIKKNFNFFNKGQIEGEFTFDNISSFMNYNNYDFLSTTIQRECFRDSPNLQESEDPVFTAKNKVILGNRVEEKLEGFGLEITVLDLLNDQVSYGEFQKGVLVQGFRKANNKCMIGCFKDNQLFGCGIKISEDLSLCIGDFKNDTNWTGKFIKGTMVMKGTFVDGLLSGEGTITVLDFELTGRFESGKLVHLISFTGDFDPSINDINFNQNSQPIKFYVDPKSVADVFKIPETTNSKIRLTWTWWGALQVSS